MGRFALTGLVRRCVPTFPPLGTLVVNVLGCLVIGVLNLGLGLLLAAPTIAAHGTQEQIDTMVRDIVTGQQAWCQLFSEPGAGSDLAGLTCKAVKDGDEYVINGQKIFVGSNHGAEYSWMIVQTDPEGERHHNLSWFMVPMDSPGITVEPMDLLFVGGDETHETYAPRPSGQAGHDFRNRQRLQWLPARGSHCSSRMARVIATI